jgi:ATP-dependent DNA ligase
VTISGVTSLSSAGPWRKYVKGAEPALLYSDHMVGDDGKAMFRHACAMGLEGIVSKRATSR